MDRKIKQACRPISRRDFLRSSAGYAAMGSAPLLSSMLSLGMTGTAAAALPVSGYKALVCIFLHGGADSFNMLVPGGTVAYTDYATARGNLALNRADMLQIADAADNNRWYFLHPGFQEVRSLYNQGNLAFVANVGSLVEPLDIQAYFENARLPLGLFSHNDQRQHWQSSKPQQRISTSGWAGRMSELVVDTSVAESAQYANIAVGGSTLLQTGSSVSPYVIGESGTDYFRGYGFEGTSGEMEKVYVRTTNKLLAASYSDIFRQTYADQTAAAVAAGFQYRWATSPERMNISTPFPSTELGNALRQVAYAIGARDILNQSRQVFFVSMQGWDHHDDLLTGMDELVPQLSAAMQAFYSATEELGVANEVIAFTASDFARTLSSNGDGSDHAWGGNHMVMGGAVNGGRIYGAYPESLAPGNDLDIGRGRLIPTTSTDEYHAELARWFGIGNDSNLELVLPNIRNFYSEDTVAGPLGMLT
jgi:uncharacterized protein (DUF1501 family)